MKKDIYKVLFNIWFLFMISCLILSIVVLVKLLVTGVVTMPIKRIIFALIGMLIIDIIYGYKITEEA